jgi:hypothetical protein
VSDVSTPRRISAPSPRLLWLEQRVVLEFASLGLAAPWLAGVDRGDGHPVLVLPGFGTGDGETRFLRRQLRRWGYWAHGWQQGRNLGPTPNVQAGLVQRLASLYRHHNRKVSLVGWSLGGIYGRELARAFPGQVRSVITLASPYRLRLDDRSSISPLVERLTGDRPPAARDGWPPEDDRAPLTVPATSIYSRTDGIVRWHACIDREGPRRENVEVLSSHVGLAVNPSVLYVIGDRLAQPEGTWSPFRPPPRLRRLYPAPAAWDDAGGGSRGQGAK